MVDQVLFRFREYVQLWSTGSNAPNINGPMIQYNTKAYKGATNTIDFVVRNNDRKPINLAAFQIHALIQRVETVTTITGNGFNPLAELLLVQPVQLLQDTAGTCRLTLTDAELSNWPAGFYRYTIRLTDITGRQEFLYTDLNRSTYGTFELIEGLSTSLVPAINISACQFTPATANDLTGQYVFVSGAVQGDAQAQRSNGMHTVVAYTGNSYSGKFWIQASLNLNVPTDQDWTNIPIGNTTDYFQYNPPLSSPTIKAFNFTGNYYWIRFAFENPYFYTCPLCSNYFGAANTCVTSTTVFNPVSGPWTEGPNPQIWPAPYPPPPAPYPPPPSIVPATNYSYSTTPPGTCTHGFFAGILYKN